MATVGNQPDPDQTIALTEGGEAIVDLFISGEITLEQYMKMLPKAESEVMPSA